MTPVVIAVANMAVIEKVSLTIFDVSLVHSIKSGVQRAAQSNLLIDEHSYQHTGPTPLNLF